MKGQAAAFKKQIRTSHRPFAVFDIDGTLIRWQLYHAIADELAKQGLVDSKTYAAIRDARMLWKQRTHEESFKDYERRLVEAYQQVLRKLAVEQFEQAATAVFEEYKNQVYTYTRDLIGDLKAKGYLLFAISGSQTEIVEKVSRHYGFDDYVGTTYERQGSRFTGNATVHLGGKHIILKQLITKHKASLEGSIAVGDAASDISMLEAVEQPIAFNPEKKLFGYAKQKGWKIVVERKNMVYELEQKNGTYQLL